jgi:hypothetical protein
MNILIKKQSLSVVNIIDSDISANQVEFNEKDFFNFHIYFI